MTVLFKDVPPVHHYCRFSDWMSFGAEAGRAGAKIPRTSAELDVPGGNILRVISKVQYARYKNFGES